MCVFDSWAQLGGGQGRRVPPLFLNGGDILCHGPLYFLLSSGMVSKIK